MDGKKIVRWALAPVLPTLVATLGTITAVSVSKSQQKTSTDAIDGSA